MIFKIMAPPDFLIFMGCTITLAFALITFLISIKYIWKTRDKKTILLTISFSVIIGSLFTFLLFAFLLYNSGDKTICC